MSLPEPAGAGAGAGGQTAAERSDPFDVSARAAGFPRLLLAPGILCVAVFLVFIGAYSTYRPIDPNANILERSAIWTVPLLEWASLLSLLFWFVCLSLVLVRQKAD